MLGHIGFVPDKDEKGVGIGVALDLIDPVVFDIEEGVAVGEIEDEKDGVRIYLGVDVLL